MEQADLFNESIDRRIAQRIKSLRTERQWSLEELSGRSGVSRASLSRVENGEVSPTASVLGKICGAFGLTLSRLMVLVEEGFPPLLPRDGQVVWTDPETGFLRRAVSPPGPGLSGEVIACSLKPGTRIAYDRPPRPGLEHHLVMVEGALTLTIDGIRHRLSPGDCLRYRLHGASQFETPGNSAARYFLFMV
jgi:transcriptional regulator with XRE-family HTH domain